MFFCAVPGFSRTLAIAKLKAGPVGNWFKLVENGLLGVRAYQMMVYKYYDYLMVGGSFLELADPFETTKFLSKHTRPGYIGTNEYQKVII